MSALVDIPESAVDRLLSSLLGKDVVTATVEELDVHVRSICGLVTNDDELIGAVAADREFVYASGAALALMPAVDQDSVTDEDDESLHEFYAEVANVLSRLVNDHGSERVRIDPDIEHSREDLGLILGAADRTIFSVQIAGYGTGAVVILT